MKGYNEDNKPADKKPADKKVTVKKPAEKKEEPTNQKKAQDLFETIKDKNWRYDIKTNIEEQITDNNFSQRVVDAKIKGNKFIVFYYYNEKYLTGVGMGLKKETSPEAWKRQKSVYTIPADKKPADKKPADMTKELGGDLPTENYGGQSTKSKPKPKTDVKKELKKDLGKLLTRTLQSKTKNYPQFGTAMNIPKRSEDKVYFGGDSVTLKDVEPKIKQIKEALSKELLDQFRVLFVSGVNTEDFELLYDFKSDKVVYIKDNKIKKPAVKKVTVKKEPKKKLTIEETKEKERDEAGSEIDNNNLKIDIDELLKMRRAFRTQSTKVNKELVDRVFQDQESIDEYRRISFRKIEDKFNDDYTKSPSIMKILKNAYDNIKDKIKIDPKGTRLRNPNSKKPADKKPAVKKESVDKPADEEESEEEEPIEIKDMNHPLTIQLREVVQSLRNKIKKDAKADPSKLTSIKVIARMTRPIAEFVRKLQRDNNVEFSSNIIVKYEDDLIDNLIEDLKEIGGLKKPTTIVVNQGKKK